MKSALLLVALLAASPDPAVEKACPNGICTIPAERLNLLIEMHNQNIDRIQHLEKELLNADTTCRLKWLREG